MTSQQILQSDLLDILFERRNKLYGAYLLRKNYPMELMKALAITFLLVMALMFLSGSSKPPQTIAAERPDYTVTQVNIPKDVKPEPPKPKIQQPAAPQHKVATEIFHTQIKTVDQTNTALATQNDLNTAAIGNVKIDGPASPGIQPPSIPPVNNGGTGAGEPEVKKEEPPLPSRHPQFPGGTQAWLQFLSRHLHPPQDLEPGEKRMCLIRFSVDEEGVITNFQVVQSGGNEFDNEVIRVLKKMPKWLPAIQNGKTMAVSFTQPVTFAAAEE